MTSERNITKAIMNHLKGVKAYPVKLHGGQFQQAGLPDIMCLIQGRVVFFEVKTEIGRVSKIQSHCHAKMRDQGALVAVVRTVEDVVYLLANPDAGVWARYSE